MSNPTRSTSMFGGGGASSSIPAVSSLGFLLAARFSLALLLLLSVLPATDQLLGQDSVTAANASRGDSMTAEGLGKIPVTFERNTGQTDPRVKYLSRGAGYSLFLTSSGAVLTLRKRSGAGPGGATENTAIRMKPLDAQGSPAITAAGILGESNYFVGSDPADWQTGVPRYAEVRYEGVYPGVDLVYRGRGGRLDYDFHLTPGASPRGIGMKFSGGKLSLGRNGDLIIDAAGTSVRQPKPVTYQWVDGKRTLISSRYDLQGPDAVGFELGTYDPARPLIIDPTLAYSTYLGAGGEMASEVEVDSAGNAYVTGTTPSTEFPRKEALQGDYAGGDTDVFVTKLDPSGSELVFSTYLGGSGKDGLNRYVQGDVSLVLDPDGNAYLTGRTESSDFPTTPGAYLAGDPCADYFLTKLAADGQSLAYSTCAIGGEGIALDAMRNAYVSSFATAPAGASKIGPGGKEDIRVEKLNADGSSRLYSTYVGGSEREGPDGNEIAVMPDGTAFVMGYTYSSNFPVTTTAFQAAHAGGNVDAFLVELKPDGKAGGYSTYLGGAGNESGFGRAGIDIDAHGNVYLGGFTTSTDFPLKNAQQPQSGGGYDGFLVKLAPAESGASSLVYSTYVGGSGSEFARAVSVDASGNAFLAGETLSSDFPTKDPLQSYAGTDSGSAGADAFVTKLASDGTLAYATYVGGTGRENPYGIAVDEAGDVYVTGWTSSDDFPWVGGVQEERSGNANNAFVFKISWVPQPVPRVTRLVPANAPFSGGTTIRVVGENLSGVTAVRFDESPAESVSVVSDTELTAVAPPSADERALVILESAAGSSPRSESGLFHYGEGLWLESGAMTSARAYHSATLLRNGKVLVAGGCAKVGSCPQVLATAELYDPLTEQWTATGPMTVPRMRHTATPLSDGRVLVVGGRTACTAAGCSGTGSPVASAEIYDPSTGTWLPTGPLARQRVGHTTTPLSDGSVMVIGGCDRCGDRHSAEVLSPPWVQWAPVPDTSGCPAPCGPGRVNHSATRLEDGRILLAGGQHDNQSMSESSFAYPAPEVFEPGAASAQGRWREAGDNIHRYRASATLLSGAAELCGDNCGKVLLVGGLMDNSSPMTEAAELFDPKVMPLVPLEGGLVPVQSQPWRPTDSLAQSRGEHVAALLPNGKVLVGGGCFGGGGPITGCSSYRRSAELFDPVRERWHSTAPMDSVSSARDARYHAATATVLSGEPNECADACGKVLITGGSQNPISQLYTPAPAVTGISSSAEGEFTITGSGFNNNTQYVLFAGVSASSFTVDSPTQITALAPDAYGDGKISVLTDGGLATSKDVFAFLDVAPVKDLSAEAVSATEATLKFSAPYARNSDPNDLSPVADYVIKQSTAPITDDATFDASRSLCDGKCSFSPQKVGDQISLAVTELSPDTTYYYALKAHDAQGDAGPLSNVASVTTLGALPGTPTDLAATALSGSEIRLAFSAVPRGDGGARPIDDYVVKQSTSPIASRDDFDQAHSFCGGVCEMTPRHIGDELVVAATDLTPRTTHYYAVAAQDHKGRLGPLSPVVEATTTGTTPGKVEDLVADLRSDSDVRLTFSAVGSDGPDSPPASGYIIKQSRSPITDADSFEQAKAFCGGTCAFSPREVGDGITFVVTGLAAGTTYHYAVRARNDSGDVGPISDVVNVVTPARSEATPSPARRVDRLVARRLSPRIVELMFPAAPLPGVNAEGAPPAIEYVFKQSTKPISRRNFVRAKSLCGGVCRFEAKRVGQTLELVVGELTPGRKYFYAFKAVGAEKAKGPFSGAVKAPARPGRAPA